MTRRQLLTLGLSSGLLAVPRQALAIFASGSVVHDPGNMSQNVLTAGRTLLSNQHEARMILQNVESLANQAKNLVAIPVNLITQIEAQYQDYQRVLSEGQRLIGGITGTVQQYERLFASGWNGNGTLMQQAQAMMGKVREAGRLSTQTGYLYDRLLAQGRTVNQLLTTSQTAPGSLAAQQATNKLLGTLSNQQANLQLLMAANNQMHTSWIMSQVVAAEQAKAFGQSQMINPAQYNWLGPGQGRGGRLP